MPKKAKVEAADKKVAKAVRPLKNMPAVRAAGTLSEVADQPQLVTLCSATLAAGLIAHNPRLARAGARMLAAELVATALKSAVKHRVDRTRPHHVAKGGAYAFRAGSRKDGAYNSFPSGHTAGAVAVAGAFSREYPGGAVATYALATGIAAIQVPRGKHYASDLAAGAAIGIVAELCVDFAARFLRRTLLPSLRDDQN